MPFLFFTKNYKLIKNRKIHGPHGSQRSSISLSHSKALSVSQLLEDSNSSTPSGYSVHQSPVGRPNSDAREVPKPGPIRYALAQIPVLLYAVSLSRQPCSASAPLDSSPHLRKRALPDSPLVTGAQTADTWPTAHCLTLLPRLGFHFSISQANSHLLILLEILLF